MLNQSLGGFKTKNQDPMEIPHYFFLVTFGNSISFLINPWKFQILFLWYPWKFHILNPPIWLFTGIAHSPYPANLVSMLPHFHKMQIQVDQAVKEDMLFLACTHLRISQETKINTAAVNISKLDQSFV